MIKWIDITSPNLRLDHQEWCAKRGPRLMADVRDYNDFARHAHQDLSTCVVFPADGSSPMFRFVGRGLAPLMPNCTDGTTFSKIVPPTARTSLTVPYHRICSSRQPDCRRGEYFVGGDKRRYEQLLLPFGNDQMRVCLVHTVFDLALPV